MKKELYIPLLVLLLTLAFGSVCFLMFFFNNNKRLTNWKMKLGGLLLMLTAVASKGYGYSDDEVSCYLSPGPRRYFGYFGPTYGLNFTSIQNIYDKYLPFQLAEKYTGTGYYVGFIFEYPTNKHIPKHYLYLSLKYEQYSPEKNITIKNISFVNSLIDGYSAELNLKQRINLSYLNLGAGIDFNIISGVYLSGGLETAILLKGKHGETIEIPTSSNAAFKKDLTNYTLVNDKKIELINNEIDNINHFKISLPISLGYTFILGKSHLTPFIGYNYIFTNLTNDYNSKLSEFRIGINLIITIFY